MILFKGDKSLEGRQRRWEKSAGVKMMKIELLQELEELGSRVRDKKIKIVM